MLKGITLGIKSAANPLIDEFMHMHKTGPIRPVMAVRYVREAFVYPVSDTRITFDMDITYNLKPSASALQPNMIPWPNPDNYIVMEIKFNNFLPGLVQGIIQPGYDINNMYAESISKYADSRIFIEGE